MMNDELALTRWVGGDCRVQLGMESGLLRCERTEHLYREPVEVREANLEGGAASGKCGILGCGGL